MSQTALKPSLGQDFEQRLREEMDRQLALPGATKRSALRLALVSVIRSGILEPDARLPAETDFATMLGVSLGTVQAALGQLRDMGIVKRRRGDGTRLNDGKTLSSSIWHFRFFNRQTGKIFRPIGAEIEVLETSAKGPWVEHLGTASDYTLIRRTITSEDDDVRIGAEMVLNTDLFAPGDIPASELKSTNVRMILEERLNVKAVRVHHTVRFEQIDPRKAGLFGMQFLSPCLHLQARTFLSGDRPFYFQDIYAPAEKIELSF